MLSVGVRSSLRATRVGAFHNLASAIINTPHLRHAQMEIVCLLSNACACCRRILLRHTRRLVGRREGGSQGGKSTTLHIEYTEGEGITHEENTTQIAQGKKPGTECTWSLRTACVTNYPPFRLPGPSLPVFTFICPPLMFHRGPSSHQTGYIIWVDAR